MSERYAVEPAIGAPYWTLKDRRTEYEAGWILSRQLAERVCRLLNADEAEQAREGEQE